MTSPNTGPPKVARRRNEKRGGRAGSASGSEVAARPARVITVDIDGPPPELSFDGHFQDAWIVLCRGGAPLGISVLDLTADTVFKQARLQEDIARARASQPETPSSPPSTTALPRISVVVPTVAHHIDELALCVESLGRLDYPDFEVLLVDNRRVVPTPDPLAALAHDRPWLRVVREATPGISAARNKGVTESNSYFVAFTDDDVRVDPRWLRSIATRFLREPGLDAVTGLILPAELESAAQIWFERYFGGFGGVRSFHPVTLELDPTKRSIMPRGRLTERDAKGVVRQHSSLYGVGRYVAGANMTFRKSALEHIHGFDAVAKTSPRSSTSSGRVVAWDTNLRLSSITAIAAITRNCSRSSTAAASDSRRCSRRWCSPIPAICSPSAPRCRWR